MSDAVLQGAHVLLLEDEALINLATSDILEEMGCRVSAFLRLDDGLVAIERELPDIAVLDLNVGGVMSYPLAERLREKGVPVVFLSGYGSPARTGVWNAVPACLKPCDPAALKAMLVKVLSTGRDAKR